MELILLIIVTIILGYYLSGKVNKSTLMILVFSPLNFFVIANYVGDTRIIFLVSILLVQLTFSLRFEGEL